MNKLIQEIQLADKYSRLKPDGTKETWPEVIERVIDFFKLSMVKQNKASLIPTDWWEQIRLGMKNMDVLPSMRVVQMAGPALLRDNVGAYNCAYVALSGPADLAELLYIMMQGTGIGFSVEQQYIDNWPEVHADHIGKTNPVTQQEFLIEDSTEGWVQAYRFCIEHALNYRDKIQWDFRLIRPAGAELKTKGGYASGPEPFKMLLEKTHEIIRSKAGKRLDPFDIHRLATLAGSIVMVGGVRRAAQISLSDVDDIEMRHCKDGTFWLNYPELSMANNSAVIQAQDQLAEEWPALRASGSGERGLFNPFGPMPLRRNKNYDFGTNPCGEILLRSKQFCNLSIAVARPDDNMDDLLRKVRLATLIGTLQSCLTHFPCLSEDWKKNCEEERLLGVDITGTMDCKMLQTTNEHTAVQLTHLRDEAVRFNREFASTLEIPASTAVTCNKPSGNSSQLLDCSSGIHPRYAAFYVRRLRIGSGTLLAQHLVGIGVPVFPEVGQSALATSPVWVFELPAKAPDGAITRSAITAIEQLEYWKMWKLNWTEHNPSCTIYVGEDEWDLVYKWVWDHWNIIGGLSFLPRDNHNYQLAPYQEITEHEFLERLRSIRWTDGESLSQFAGEQAGSTDAACAGDFCEF